MAGWRPLKRRDFMPRLGLCRSILRDAPPVYDVRLAPPNNPHDPEYSVPQIRMLVRQVETIVQHEIRLDDWEKL